jgi:hypothetical protein
MAIQYRSPDEIVVMKRIVDNKDKIDLVQVAYFDVLAIYSSLPPVHSIGSIGHPLLLST